MYIPQCRNGLRLRQCHSSIDEMDTLTDRDPAMKLPHMRFTIRRMMVGVVSLLVVFALTDLYRNHRRIIWFQAAWDYDKQHRDCMRLAAAYEREAARERQEAARSLEGSSQRDSRLQAATFNVTIEENVVRVCVAARRMASELRRLARIPR